MNSITNLILIALFIEAVVDAIKPAWTGENKLTAAEYISMFIGVVLAVSCKINMLTYIMDMPFVMPFWMEYVFFAMTGIAIGRGSNFLFDLWERLKHWQSNDATVETTHELEIEELNPTDLRVNDWPLEMLIDFAKINGFQIPENLPVDKDEAKEKLIQYMFFEPYSEPEAGEIAD